MDTTTIMSWQVFKAKLQQHPELTLQFQYAADKWVDASYHITEIKQAPIVSVDCGGKMNGWTEIIMQLWEPAENGSDTAMPVHKALSIIELVGKTLPLNPLGQVKIEFGNSQFDTRQMYPGEIVVEGTNLVVTLNPDITQCKAIGRGQSCGTAANDENCCEPSAAEVKPKIQLKNLAVADPCCVPGAGCC
ncbi:MAG: hypothetical protein JWR50_521 [Mucilaginibacter sp.]|nr:hypothetical protein [Mucilaginibacter sp.]